MLNFDSDFVFVFWLNSNCLNHRNKDKRCIGQGMYPSPKILAYYLNS